MKLAEGITLEGELRERFYPHLTNASIRKKTDDCISFLKTGVVLDAGCGSGWLSLVLKEKGLDVISLDFSKQSIKECRFLWNLEGVDIPYVRASLTNLPFRKRVFDSVVCSEVLEHIYNIEMALSEVHRVLKKQGRLFMSIPNGLTYGIIYDLIYMKLLRRILTNLSYDRRYREALLEKGIVRDVKIVDRHVHQFTPSTLEKLLKKSRFRIVDFRNVTFLTPYLRSIFGMIFQRPWAFFRTFNEIDVIIADSVPLQVGTDWAVFCEKSLHVT